MNRDIMLMWIDEVDGLKPGESIFLHCEDRDHSKTTVKQFKTELKLLSNIDPVKSSTIKAMTAIRDQRYWVELKKTFGSPLIGFKKDAEGKTIRIELTDPDRARRLQCMKEDGMTLEEVEGIEGELTNEERVLFT